MLSNEGSRTTFWPLPWWKGHTGDSAWRGSALEVVSGHTEGRFKRNVFFLFLDYFLQRVQRLDLNLRRHELWTYRDARVFVEQHLEQVGRQDRRLLDLVVLLDEISVLLVGPGWGTGQVWHTTITLVKKESCAEDRVSNCEDSFKLHRSEYGGQLLTFVERWCPQ